MTVSEYTYPEFLNYAKIGVTHFCGKKASDSYTLIKRALVLGLVFKKFQTLIKSDQNMISF